MKRIFTLLLFATTFFPASSLIAQICNYTIGANGTSTSLSNPIVIDGTMNDWTPYLNDADNNSYDNTNLVDLDWPISDAGRDLTRLAFTEDQNYLYLYIQRAGSSNNKTDMIFYADINNNGVMELREPVMHIDWSGSNGTVNVSVNNYVPSLVSALNSVTTNLDGLSLGGTLTSRTSPGHIGQGSVDGTSMELKIPFNQITQVNAAGQPINVLGFGQDFKYHMSTINGNISNVPSGINDNFGGCLKAPLVLSILPVELTSFTAILGDDGVKLAWTTASEKNVSHFIIEKSRDGQNYQDAGLVFAKGNSSETVKYSFDDKTLLPQESAVIYYRLRSVDFDGQTELSHVRTIRFAKTEQQRLNVSAYPNPATHSLRVTIPASWQQKKVSYELYTNTGQVALKTVTSVASQTESIQLAALPKGLYFLKVVCNGESASHSIIKQ